MNIFILITIIAFIFIVTYDPKTGTLHRHLEGMTNRQPEPVQREYDLRYGTMSRSPSDIVGAIFSM